MITTKDINVTLDKGQGKLKQVTTKDVDASIKVVQPKEPVKPKSISTHSMADIADIAEKKKRDDIMAQRKLARKDEKKIVIVGKEIIEPMEMIYPPIAKRPKFVEPSKELMAELTKKPWKEMTDDEKKIEFKKRAEKATATRARKKEEK